jgi:hypothetical protein
MSNENKYEEDLKEEEAINETESWLSQKIFNDVQEEVYQRGSFSVTIIHAHAEGRQFQGVGFSKARQEISAAHFDSERGKKVSRGRAIHDLFSEYRRSRKKV